MKKNLFWYLGIVVIFACTTLMTINVKTSKNKKSYMTLSLSELSAGAEGICCPENGSYCTMNGTYYYNEYNKILGKCN
jgi:hypothetical protein